MIDKSKILGVILAGGKGTRMGGEEKGLIKLNNKSLIEYSIERLKPQVNRLVINANNNLTKYSEFNTPIVSDPLPGFLGPLAGVLAGLEYADQKGYSHIVTVAADTPFFPKNLISLFLTVAKNHNGLAIATTQDKNNNIQRHPTFGIWPCHLRKNLRTHIVNGLRKIVIWTEKHNAGEALFDDNKKLDPFFNINTPADLNTAKAVLENYK
ncbi:MAG: molybdenum cofactor guanylyltransferase MobA [Rhodobacterales bacterium]|jgi:molybdopterin-guanine dinucleotide biosynthesis protein A|tara:strand:+ start:1053 stop:1682 length:630 start_codon:yes stop_codon:yes gene_type:complete